MSKKIILVGKAGSGKDYLRDKFIERGFKPSIGFTTRPKRQGEEDNKEYIFLSDTEFNSLNESNKLYEYQTFNEWYYGTSLSEWVSKDIFIMSPKAVKAIRKEDRDNCFIIYLDIPMEVRAERIGKRIDSDSVERRLKSDEIDFEYFNDYDLKITNHDF